MSQYILTISMLFSSILTHASNDLFIQLKEGNTKVSLGYYSTSKLKIVETGQIKLEEITFENLSQNLPIDPQKQTLIFIHAMWGNGKGSQKGNLKTFHKLCGSDFQIINIVWKAGHLNYKKNWNQAIKTGQALAPIFDYITNQKSLGHHVFCHSMGNRIFEGILSTAKTDFKLGNVILMAPDLDTTVFDQNLKCLQAKAQQINVYVHQKDRALKISKRRHKRNRLGLNGVSLSKDWQGKIKLIDVTHTKAKGSKGISKHLYFRKDEKVKADLRSLFSKIVKPRALKLLDDKKYLYAL